MVVLIPALIHISVSGKVSRRLKHACMCSNVRRCYYREHPQGLVSTSPPSISMRAVTHYHSLTPHVSRGLSRQCKPCLGDSLLAIFDETGLQAVIVLLTCPCLMEMVRSLSFVTVLVLEEHEEHTRHL